MSDLMELYQRNKKNPATIDFMRQSQGSRQEEFAKQDSRKTNKPKRGREEEIELD